ncbi:hypothetical protein V8E36_000420 [Tilletia maclaganii]
MLLLVAPSSKRRVSIAAGGPGDGRGRRQHGQGRGRGRGRGDRAKLLCLVALAVQNAALAIVMHHSRVSVPPEQRYHTATAVLLVEVLKGTISLLVAYCSLPTSPSPSGAPHHESNLGTLARKIASPDCMALAIPAALYVLQQRLQYTAAANLDPTTFTVSYQAKILTTALFSFLLLGTRIRPVQWVALFGLAVGVAVVQIQSLEARQAINTLGQTMQAKANGMDKTFFLSPHPPLLGLSNPFHRRDRLGSSEGTEPAQQARKPYHTVMDPFVGFLAVGAACLTSGFAGVYFEMLLKGRAGSRRGSASAQCPGLPSATTPAAFEEEQQSGTYALKLEPLGGETAITRDPRRSMSASTTSSFPNNTSKHERPTLWIRNVQLSLLSLPPALIPVLLEAGKHGLRSPFAHITHPAALLTIAMQVLGGLLTALVIRYADNILKGFAVAFSVLLSFAWSVLVVGNTVGADGSAASDGIRFNGYFFLGSAMTLASTFLYNRHSTSAASCRSEGTGRRRTDSSSESWSDPDGGFTQAKVSRHSHSDGDDGELDRPFLHAEKEKGELLSIRSEDPTVLSSVWASARRPSTSGWSSGSGSGSGRNATTLRSPMPGSGPDAYTPSSLDDRHRRGGAPRFMAEAGAAWATVVSYSQIPLATSAGEDDDDGGDNHEGRRDGYSRRGDGPELHGRKARSSMEVPDTAKPERDVYETAFLQSSCDTIDSQHERYGRAVGPGGNASNGSATMRQSFLSRLPHSSSSSNNNHAT